MDELTRLQQYYGDGERGERLVLASYFRRLNRREIPETYPPEVAMPSPFLDYYRSAYIQLMGYSLVCRGWVRPLARFIGSRRVLEIMSGTGALAKALQDEGTDIIATDDFSWKATFAGQWTRVEKRSALSAIRKYGRSADFILMSWPYLDAMALKALEKMRIVNPDCRLIYIGEPKGGCNANDAFFESAVLDEANTELEPVRSAYPCWHSFSDTVYLYK